MSILSSSRKLRPLVNLSREVIDMPLRLLPMAKSGGAQKQKRSLLIIRPDGIGDFVFFLDTFKEYRKLYPPEDWEITLLGNKIWRVMALDMPYADHYWFMDIEHFTRAPIYRYRLLHQVRNANFDLAIQPVHSRRYWVGDAIVRASGAHKRIGLEGDLNNITPRQKRHSDGWYTSLVPAEAEKMNELERNAEFIRGLGLTDFRADLPKMIVPDNAQKRVDVMLAELHLKESDYSELSDFYILFPGAGAQFRQWPVERFADLSRCIYDYTGWTGLICGGPGEEMLAEQLLSLAVNVPLLSLSGKTNLIELAGIIKRCKILIGNETGAVHIAAAVGAPSICILGGGHFGRFTPYSVTGNLCAVYTEMECFGCNWKCIYSAYGGKPVPCIEEIQVLQIMDTVMNYDLDMYEAKDL